MWKSYPSETPFWKLPFCNESQPKNKEAADLPLFLYLSGQYEKRKQKAANFQWLASDQLTGELSNTDLKETVTYSARSTWFLSLGPGIVHLK